MKEEDLNNFVSSCNQDENYKYLLHGFVMQQYLKSKKLDLSSLPIDKEIKPFLIRLSENSFQNLKIDKQTTNHEMKSVVVHLLSLCNLMKNDFAFYSIFSDPNVLHKIFVPTFPSDLRSYIESKKVFS